MRKEYTSRGKRSTVRRNRRITRTGIVLLIIISTAMCGDFSIGAKNESDKQYENFYHEKDKDTVDLIVDPIDSRNRQKSDAYTDSEDINDWRLLLVNADNPIPKGYSFELSNIDGIRQFDSRAIDDLMKLMEACRDQTGSSIWAQSTYRDRNTQERLFKAQAKQYMDEGKSSREAEKLARTSVSVPGTSEHEIGLAVDFNNVDFKFEKSPAFKWLMENAHEYGFILRYPRHKQSITGVTYEPWHFRYVGKDHANMIKQNDFCLEEYIDYLKDQSED